MTLRVLTPDGFTLPGFPGADPLGGLVGGVLIGVAAAFVLLGLGRIAGISGIAARAFGLSDEGMSRAMALLFILGLPVGAGIVHAATGLGEGVMPAWPFLLIAGFVVGFGTRLGSGCTSGHGVCGMSRFSARSVVATLTFIASGVVTIAVMRAWGAAG